VFERRLLAKEFTDSIHPIFQIITNLSGGDIHNEKALHSF
jgi:hypothetical protein